MRNEELLSASITCSVLLYALQHNRKVEINASKCIYATQNHLSYIGYPSFDQIIVDR